MHDRDEEADLHPVKYNNWCERRPLVCAEEDNINRAGRFSIMDDLSASEQDAFYLHELTGYDGFEFVAFSNGRIEDPVRLPKGVVLVPCFLKETELQGSQEQLAQLTMRMMEQCRFVYDGWVPISGWETESVREAVRSVDEALSTFCLSGDTYFSWESKYSATSRDSPIYHIEDLDLRDLQAVSILLDAFGEEDRKALYRSLGWLSQGLRLSDPVARFLFSILAIEALATYIELGAPEESPLTSYRAERLSATERESARKDCIHTALSEWLETNPVRAVQTAYTECVVGIRRRLRTHLEHLFGADSEANKLLFEPAADGKSLYDLRNDIAHGTVDALSEMQRQMISRRVWDAERLARGYILAVLEGLLGDRLFTRERRASVSFSMKDVVASREGMVRGPTHMAAIYTR